MTDVSMSIIGRRFSKLTVVRVVGKQKKRALCSCDCGGEVEVYIYRLLNGKYGSCGCLGKEPKDNLIGRKFGLLSVVSLSNVAPNGGGSWRCRCDCGSELVIYGAHLLAGKYSCGCTEKPHRESFNSKKRDEELLGTWKQMKYRCYSKTNKNYKWYGGRGIYVCDRWLRSFESFVADMGERPAGHTLDRIDPSGPYAPWNCRWATHIQQQNNKLGADHAI